MVGGRQILLVIMKRYLESEELSFHIRDYVLACACTAHPPRLHGRDEAREIGFFLVRPPLALVPPSCTYR